MAFPDRIEPSVALAHPPDKVCAALTTAEGLSSWFGEKARIDLYPGGAGQMTFGSGLSVEMRVERVEEPRVFAFTWRIPELPEDDPRRTHVEIHPRTGRCHTRLQLAETGFAQLPDDTRRGPRSPSPRWVATRRSSTSATRV